MNQNPKTFASTDDKIECNMCESSQRNCTIKLEDVVDAVAANRKALLSDRRYYLNIRTIGCTNLATNWVDFNYILLRINSVDKRAWK